MFPTVDVAVLELILESNGGSQDRAIEQLLQMTDENFKPDELHGARSEEEVGNTPIQYCRHHLIRATVAAGYGRAVREVAPDAG